MIREEMEKRTAHTTVKAEKIRILFRAGVPRAEIARFLGISYQHVQNVLKRSRDLQDSAPPAAPESVALWIATVEKGGRITVPTSWLEQSGVCEGDVLVCRPEGDSLRIMTRAVAADALRKAARRHMPGEAALLDALIGDAERLRSG